MPLLLPGPTSQQLAYLMTKQLTYRLTGRIPDAWDPRSNTERCWSLQAKRVGER
jgi:hypothetical protein